jgi:hypothetical protein
VGALNLSFGDVERNLALKTILRQIVCLDPDFPSVSRMDYTCPITAFWWTG